MDEVAAAAAGLAAVGIMPVGTMPPGLGTMPPGLGTMLLLPGLGTMPPGFGTMPLPGLGTMPPPMLGTMLLPAFAGTKPAGVLPGICTGIVPTPPASDAATASNARTQAGKQATATQA